ncbi:hypothetical protein [Paenibacillus sp. J22TS3]|nr:hypothetical protein [Paenibacillus sp. J22TS3]GIP19836.1 hypothetical protein J22TS3_01110 [Paenibacillus sp. J22TS3]
MLICKLSKYTVETRSGISVYKTAVLISSLQAKLRHNNGPEGK